MGTLISLARFRKARARAEKAREADERRAISGRTKFDRALSEAQSRRDSAHLDGVRRDNLGIVDDDESGRTGG
jgi:hypothetical protein